MVSTLGSRPATARTSGFAVAVAVLAAAGVLGLAVLVAHPSSPLSGWERGFDESVHAALRHSDDTVDAATWVSTVFDPDVVSIVAGVLAALLLLLRRVRAAVYVVVARFGELAVETVTKDVVARPRPQLAHPFASPDGYSFPSGHTGGTAALLVAVLVLLAPLLRARAARVAAGVTVLVAVAAVATSRVLLGAHYPTDVLGGALLGVAVALAAVPILPAAPLCRTTGSRG